MATDNPFEAWLRLFSPTINLPASGDIGSFSYHPNTQWEAPSLYRGNELIEQTVYRQVASPGSQLGTIVDALMVLCDMAEKSQPELAQQKEMIELRALAGKVNETKASVKNNGEKMLRAELDRLKEQDPEAFNRLLTDYQSAG